MKKCFGCGNDVPDTPFHNVYYTYNRKEETTLCENCLEFMFKLSMNPPQIVLTPNGPTRLCDTLCVPFKEDSWIVIRCK